MYRLIGRSLGLMALAAALFACLAGAAQVAESGYLKDYSQLKAEKDPTGIERRVWASPTLSRERYQKVLIEPVEFYPAPKPSEHVSAQTLEESRGCAWPSRRWR